MIYPRFKRGIPKLLRHGILPMLLVMTVPLGPRGSSCGEGGSYIAELEIEGFPSTTLSQLPVISNETEIIEVGSKKHMIISKNPGKTRYSNIVLALDMDAFPEQMQNWRQEIIVGIFTKR